MAQQGTPYAYPPPPPYINGAAHGNGNGRSDLSRGYLPVVMVVALLAGVASASWSASAWLTKQDEEKRTVGQRLDTLQVEVTKQGTRLESIDSTLKQLVPSRPWSAEVKR